MGKLQSDEPTVSLLRLFDRSTPILAVLIADRSFHAVLRRAEQQLVQLTTQDGPHPLAASPPVLPGIPHRPALQT